MTGLLLLFSKKEIFLEDGYTKFVSLFETQEIKHVSDIDIISLRVIGH